MSEAITGKSEIEMLRERAIKLGIKFRSNTGAVKLSKMIDKVLGSSDESAEYEDTRTTAQIQGEEHTRLRKESARLVRVVVSCMNPAKREYEGEVFTVGNTIVGTHKKYVPFNNDAGYHIPNIIYKHLVERECQIFHTVINPNGTKRRVGKLIKEFAVQLLPPLTELELKELADRQALNRSID